MANREETYSPEFHSVFVETNLDTHIVILAHIHDTIPDFKEKFYKEHKQFYPEIGEISISSLKVKRRGIVYRLPDSNNINKVFEGFRSTNWFLQADLVRVENHELLAIMAPEQNEIANDSVLVDGNTKCLDLEYGLESKVVEKKMKKRKMESLDGNRSRKKSKISLDLSAVATTSGRDVVDESRELGGKVLDAVAMTESLAVSPRDKVDNILAGARVKDIENEKNGISMVENQQSSDVDMQCQEKTMTMNPELVQANQTVKEALETDGSQKSCGKVPSEKLDDFTGAIEQDLEMGKKSADLVMIGQEKELAPTLEHVDAHITSRDDVTESHEACAEVQVVVAPEHCDTLSREKLDDLLPGAIEKDIGRGEGSSLAPGAADNLQTTELVTYQENQLEGSSGLTTGPATEKKRRRKKSSKDDINQSAAAASKTSRKIVNEISGVPENVMVEKPVEDVGRDNIETDNLVSYPANHLEANIGLTIAPVSEKKRKRKKSSKDDISQSIAAATSTSREIVNDIDGVTGNVDRVNSTSESLAVSERENLGNPLAEAMQKENEMGDKIDDDAGIGRAIPSATENIQTDNFVSYPENQLEASSGLITGTATEKKKRRKKSSKDHVNQSTAAATTLSREIVNGREKVSGSIDHVGATSEVFPNLGGEKIVNAHIETIQNENEMGDKIVDKVGNIEATPNGADEIQAEDNVQVADLATALPTDHIGKFTDDRRTLEHEVAKDNGEIDAGEAKSVKSMKKKKSRKTKTPNGADEIQAEDNVQVAALATTLPMLVQESKTLDHIGKFTDDKRTLEPEVEVAKDNGEIDADEAKSAKSTKKKSRKTKTPAKEDTLVDSGPQIVEPFKVVDEEGPDNVIRNVLDSLHQGNETQENLDKIEKKVSKRSKKKPSLNIAESQVLPVEVNNAAQEAVPQINNPEDTDASWTSVKKYTQIDVADNNLSQQTQIEKVNMADNFGSRQKDDIVGGGGKKQDKVPRVDKSKKEKRGLDLHPSGSIDGSLSSMKRKERNSKAQPASSGTSQLKSRLKNDRSAPKKVDDSITSVKKSSNSLTVNKYKLNFFKDAEMWNSSEDESDKRTSPNFSTKTPLDSSNVSTKTPSDNSSNDDSDVTSMSRKQGNNLAGGTFKYAGSLKDIVRSSQSYKKAKVSASQYMSDEDESPAIDVVPDSQAI
ncbi:hypothetical protein AALP_AA6G161300 [Arabis alpina]|uniref:Uncharacterized protein n=1 Tax=Arabis alpina TaxID=50452 RepID=A0A087GPK6_ARAAL|nr:hypothetical protein AALP_AA6G161300 [Arabis alpina]